MAGRKRKINRGRWAIERERCHLFAFQPPPEDDGGEVVSDSVGTVMKWLGLESDVWLRALEADWVAMMGKTVAAHARPGRYVNGTLTIFVDTTVWLNELRRFSFKEMQQKLQDKFGADKIRRVIMQLDPDV